MDILRRKHAPITAQAWEAIDEQAREVLRSNLSARKLVDVSGPHGLTYAAVNIGRLNPASVEAPGGLRYGIRQVQPLVEVRMSFVLDLWELDNIERGAEDPELGPLIDAAMKVAEFEERAVYYGFNPAGIVGMAQATSHPKIELSRDPGHYAERVARAVVALKKAGEEPPYTLVVGPQLAELIESGGAYPPRKQIESLIGGRILLSPVVDGAFLVSSNTEGDFELTLGQDLAVGYESHDGQKARLFLTESFTFRVLEPQAVVAFELAGAKK